MFLLLAALTFLISRGLLSYQAIDSALGEGKNTMEIAREVGSVHGGCNRTQQVPLVINTPAAVTRVEVSQPTEAVQAENSTESTLQQMLATAEGKVARAERENAKMKDKLADARRNHKLELKQTALEKQAQDELVSQAAKVATTKLVKQNNASNSKVNLFGGCMPIHDIFWVWY